MFPAAKTFLTSDQTRDGEILKKGGLVDGFPTLVALGKSRQILVRQLDHVHFHAVTAGCQNETHPRA